ncbi:hypothetical protein TNCV_2634541 [Trichonephila clavipes]|nr:hypothetical protein TNCV_2634541 [Trichonephila clavipes]
MANHLVFMLRSEALRLDEWQQAELRGMDLDISKDFAVRIREEERVFLLAVGKCTLKQALVTCFILHGERR